jgi:hypothetical protein
MEVMVRSQVSFAMAFIAFSPHFLCAPGNSFPFKGHKGSFYRGGLSATAIIHSKLIPESARGTNYQGLVHVTDWYPTILGLATNKQWNSINRVDRDAIDGLDVWDAMMNNAESPRQEIVHYLNEDNAVYQYQSLKLFNGLAEATVDEPGFIFNKEIGAHTTALSCSTPSLMDSSRSTYQVHIPHTRSYYSRLARKILKIMILLVGVFLAVIFLIVYSAHRLEPTSYVPRGLDAVEKLHDSESHGRIIRSVASDTTPLISDRG